MENSTMFYQTRRYQIMFEVNYQFLTITVYDKSGEDWANVAEKEYNLLKVGFREAFKDLRKSFNI